MPLPRPALLACSVGLLLACQRHPDGAREPAPPTSITAEPPAPAPSASASTPPAAAAPPCPLRRWLTSFAFAPDGQRVATSCEGYECVPEPADTAIDVWDLGAGRVVHTLEAPSSASRLEWPGAGILVAHSNAGTGNKDITLWDAVTYQQLHTATHYCAYARFDRPLGRMLVVGCDGVLGVYDTRGRRLAARPDTEAHRGGDYGVSGWFSRDGRRVYVDDESAGFELVDAATLRRRAVVPGTGHGRGPRTALVAAAPEGDRLAVRDGTGAVRLLRADLSPAETLVAAGGAPAKRLGWVGEQRLALFAEDETVTILDVASRAVLLTLPPAPAGKASCQAWIEASPRGGYLTFGRTDCVIEVLDAALTKRWSIAPVPAPQPWAEVQEVAPGTAWSPDDRFLAAIFAERRLVIFDAATGARKVERDVTAPRDPRAKEGATSRWITPRWSPDGRFAVVANGDLLLVRPESGALVALSVFEEAGKRLPVVSSDTGFDGPPALERCAFPTPTARPAAPALLARFAAGR